MGSRYHKNDQHILEVLEYLRSTTDKLARSNAEGTDIEDIEKAVIDRQRAVARLTVLVSDYPDDFDESHLAQLRESHIQGKRALEALLDKRRDGWALASGLSQNEYVLKTFSRLESLPDQSLDA